MTRKYAEGTTVDVAVTQGEMRALLGRYGARAFGMAEGESDDGRTRAFVQFVLGGLPYRFTLEHPTPEEVLEAYVAEAMRVGVQAEYTVRARASNMNWRAKATAEWRRRWRARLLWLKATLEYADGEGEEEIARSLLPFLVLPGDGNRTLWDQARRELPTAFAEGRAPLQLLGG